MEPADVYIALAVRESSTRRAQSGTCDLPLPEPDGLPFSTGRDELGRGVIWEVTARVVRESNGDSSEHTSCEIDVQPELVPPPA